MLGGTYLVRRIMARLVPVSFQTLRGKGDPPNLLIYDQDTRALGYELCAEAQYQPLPHAGLLENSSPALIQFVGPLESNLSADLEVLLAGNELVRIIRACMQF